MILNILGIVRTFTIDSPLMYELGCWWRTWLWREKGLWVLMWYQVNGGR